MISLASFLVSATLVTGALAAFLPGRKVRIPRVTFRSLVGSTVVSSLRAGFIGA
jgi:nucleoside permease NupC